MLSLNQKQATVIQAINDPSIDVIVLIGSIETGKTFVAAHGLLSIAETFPKTFIPIIRLNATTSKKTVWRTYLKLLNDMNFVDGRDYTLNRQDGEIRLGNGSVLFLTEANHQKDPDHMKLKGLDANAEHIDEVDEIKEAAYDMAQSRVGRDPFHPAPAKTIVTMNPNNKWCKEKFYDPWKAGTLPSNIKVIEFTRYDSWSDQSRYDKFEKTRPKAWVERYIRNNWDFADDLNSLFKYRHFDTSISHVLDGSQRRTIGYDVARSGEDRSVVALWYGRTLVDIQIIKDSDEQMTTDDQAMLLIKYMTQNSVVAEDVAIDAVGIGVGVVDHMKSKGIFVKQFVSGSRPLFEQYDNLRSQVIYEFALGLEKGTIKIYDTCPLQKELISEAMAHLHNIGDKKLSVESKEKVKQRTGSLSPDIMDAVVMGLYPQLALNPAEDQDRILF